VGRAVPQTYICQKLRCPVTSLPAAHSSFSHWQLDVLASGKDREEVKALKDKAQAGKPQTGEITI
jgi:hypothetical protein